MSFLRVDCLGIFSAELKTNMRDFVTLDILHLSMGRY